MWSCMHFVSQGQPQNGPNVLDMKEGFLLRAMLLQCQTYLHLRWEILLPLTGDLRQDKDAAIYWSEPSFQMKMLHPGTTPHTGQLEISAPSFVAAEVATQRGHTVWIPSLFQQPQQTPPACVGDRMCWLTNHTEVLEHEQGALTLTSVDVMPRKPLASPAQDPNCSCCRASTSPMQSTMVFPSFAPYQSLFLTLNFQTATYSSSDFKHTHWKPETLQVKTLPYCENRSQIKLVLLQSIKNVQAGRLNMMGMCLQHF